MNKEKIGNRIKKVIERFPSHAVIKRETRNDFGEYEGEEFVANITGYYHRDNRVRVINIKVSTGGTSVSNISEKLMMVYDERIKEGDYCYLNDVRYKVIDPGNTLDIYMDLILERA